MFRHLLLRKGSGFILWVPTKVSEDGSEMAEVVPLGCKPEEELIIHGVLESAVKPIAFVKQSTTEECGDCSDI
jgi:hypothetical protein